MGLLKIWYKEYCTQKAISLGLLGAFLWSGQFYIMWIGLNFALLNTILALGAVYLFFRLNTNEAFFMGAFVGLFLFYWISFSLYYYDLTYLAFPFLLILTFVYGSIFAILAWIKSKYFWFGVILFIFWFDILAPFGFNWLMPEALFAYTFFGVNKYQLAAIVIACATFLKFNKYYKIIAVFILFLAIERHEFMTLAPLKIKLIETKITQSQKWTPGFKNEAVNSNLLIIDSAIKDGYDFIILPETAFPFALNLVDEVTMILKEKSFEIAILAGSLRIDENNTIYNSSYLFQDGKMQIFDKVIAVPFGEVTNFVPNFMRDAINKIFFNGARDYETAKNPSDFEIKGVKFRNAICYEATKEMIYENAPKYVAAMSNNAWFVPSIEPVYQKALMKYYAKKYRVSIYHSVNESPAFTVRP